MIHALMFATLRSFMDLNTNLSKLKLLKWNFCHSRNYVNLLWVLSVTIHCFHARHMSLGQMSALCKHTVNLLHGCKTVYISHSTDQSDFDNCFFLGRPSLLFMDIISFLYLNANASILYKDDHLNKNENVISGKAVQRTKRSTD